jgi:hypothetical protein
MTTSLLDTAAITETKKAGRPAKHADAAARQRAYRAANAVKSIRLDGKLAPTIAKLAEQFETTETHVINNMLRFALVNKNWTQTGIGGWDISDARLKTGKRAAPAERDDSLDSFSLV